MKKSVAGCSQPGTPGMTLVPRSVLPTTQFGGERLASEPFYPRTPQTPRLAAPSEVDAMSYSFLCPKWSTRSRSRSTWRSSPRGSSQGASRGPRRGARQDSPRGPRSMGSGQGSSRGTCKHTSPTRSAGADARNSSALVGARRGSSGPAGSGGLSPQPPTHPPPHVLTANGRCIDFAKTGQCRFGTSCRFQHLFEAPTPTRDVIVAAAKAFQRSTSAGSDLWHDWCSAQGTFSRDPLVYCEAELRAFIDWANVPQEGIPPEATSISVKEELPPGSQVSQPETSDGDDALASEVGKAESDKGSLDPVTENLQSELEAAQLKAEEAKENLADAERKLGEALAENYRLEDRIEECSEAEEAIRAKFEKAVAAGEGYKDALTATVNCFAQERALVFLGVKVLRRWCKRAANSVPKRVQREKGLKPEDVPAWNQVLKVVTKKQRKKEEKAARLAWGDDGSSSDAKGSSEDVDTGSHWDGSNSS